MEVIAIIKVRNRDGLDQSGCSGVVRNDQIADMHCGSNRQDLLTPECVD